MCKRWDETQIEEAGWKGGLKVPRMGLWSQGTHPNPRAQAPLASAREHLALLVPGSLRWSEPSRCQAYLVQCEQGAKRNWHVVNYVWMTCLGNFCPFAFAGIFRLDTLYKEGVFQSKTSLLHGLGPNIKSSAFYSCHPSSIPARGEYVGPGL